MESLEEGQREFQPIIKKGSCVSGVFAYEKVVVENKSFILNNLKVLFLRRKIIVLKCLNLSTLVCTVGGFRVYTAPRTGFYQVNTVSPNYYETLKLHP